MRYRRASLLIGLASLLLAGGCAGQETSNTAQSSMTAPAPAGQVPVKAAASGIASDPCRDISVTMHIRLLPNGTITDVTEDKNHPDLPCYQHAYENARQALLKTGRLQLPAGKTYQAITFIFKPGETQ
jgi:hypothetical protein